MYHLKLKIISKKKISTVLFALSISLMGLNIIGLFINPRNQDLYKEKFENGLGVKLSESEFYDQLDKIFGNTLLSDSSKVTLTTELVNKGMAHYWNIEKKYKYNLTVPVYENYILFTCSFLYPSRFEMYEFSNWKKALKRGVGLCSQHAIIESEILNERGIRSSIVALNGHVIIISQISNTKWITADPDYGVNIPFDLEKIENNVDIIEPFYLNKGYDNTTIKMLKDIYKRDGNITSENATAYLGKFRLIENISYWLIWILPLILIIPYLINTKPWLVSPPRQVFNKK